MRPWRTAGRVYQPQIVHDIVGPDGKVVRPFKPKILHKMKVPAERPQDHAQRRRATRSCVRHTYNLVDLPIKVAGKSGTAEFGTRDSKGRLPFHSWFVGFVPKDARARVVQQAPIRSSSSSRSPTTRGRRATSATEIVKYFLQLHFGIKKDYRLPNLLQRGNFYQSN